MKRKIVQHGSSSLTVSLPYSWAKKFNLKKGDEIDLDEKGSYIVISPKEASTSNKATFIIKNKKTFLGRYIINLYKQGYDEIEIICEEGLPIHVITDVLNEVIGFEIVEQGAKRCIIRNIAQAVDSEFDMMLRRAFLVTITFAKDTLIAFNKKDFNTLKELSKMQDTNNKLTSLCQRILTKKGYKIHAKTNFLYSIIDQLEQMADHIGDMCDYFYDNNAEISKKLLKKFEEVILQIEAFYDLFYNFNEDKMYKFKHSTNTLMKSLLQFYGELDGKQLVMLQFLIQMLERVNHSGLYMTAV